MQSWYLGYCVTSAKSVFFLTKPVLEYFFLLEEEEEERMVKTREEASGTLCVSLHVLLT